jgi:acetylornithine deacetylase/succinyl-diaminopimelate desuccinylase-like protein
MRLRGLLAALALAGMVSAQTIEERARDYLADLIRLDTTSPPGNETRVASYLERVARENGIEAELAGPDPARLNFIARLRGSGARRPLLLMAHSDVVPADASQWRVPPFAAEVRDAEMYGRGAQDDKSLLAAELAVMVELKRQAAALDRDVILVSEADEESGSSGMRWLVAKAWDKIEAEAAFNEAGLLQELASGVKLFQVQTTEKVPTRITMIAHGTAGHASLPRTDNAVLRLARALARLDAAQPVRLNATTRRYFTELARLGEFGWLQPLVPLLDAPGAEMEAARRIRDRDPELDAQLHATISPTILRAGNKINVIPNTAEAQVDIRRLPDERADEVVDRMRRLVNDPAVDIVPADEPEMPPTEPSPIASDIYLVMERVLRASAPKAVVVPYMSRGATDGAYLRQKGVAVYGLPLFAREDGDTSHGNDERIALSHLASGTGLLWRLVTAVAGPTPAP